MARILGLIALAGLLICLVLAAPTSAAITCQQVNRSVLGCAGYISRGGNGPPPTPCCGGIRTLNSMAVTTPDRQTACRCLKTLATNFGNLINPRVIAGLPGRCGVVVPYPISTQTDCSRVR